MLCPALLLCASPGAAQQQYLNLDFETASYRVSSEPWGWRRIAVGGEMVGTVRFDTAMKHRGRQSLRIERSGGRPVAYLLVIPAAEAGLLAKELRLSGWVRSSALRAGTFRLLLNASGASIDTAVLGQDAVPNEWQPVNLRVLVPSDATGNVVLRFDMRGEGVVWVDDLQLLVNGTRVDSIPRGTKPSAEQREWVARNVVAFNDVPGPGSSRETTLRSMFRDAKIIGLGETTHGTSEFRTAWRRFIEFAARDLGVTVVALEASQLTTERLNHWISGGAGELSSLLADDYTMWRNEAMVELLTWMRRYNRQSARRLELVGIDAINIMPEVDSVLAILGAIDTEYSSVAHLALRRIKDVWDALYDVPESSQTFFRQPPRDSVSVYRKSAESLLEHLRSNDARYRTVADSARVNRLARYANAILQGVLVLQSEGNDLAGRDSMLAANLKRELDARGPQTRAVFAAHAIHVGRLQGRMGHHLHRMFGTSYVPVALTSFRGTYTALTIAAAAPTFRSASVPLDAAFPGTIEEMLHQIRAQYLVLDLRGSDRLLSTIRTRWVGGGLASDDAASTALEENWDLIFHIDVTTAQRVRPCPQRVRCWAPG